MSNSKDGAERRHAAVDMIKDYVRNEAREDASRDRQKKEAAARRAVAERWAGVWGQLEEALFAWTSEPSETALDSVAAAVVEIASAVKELQLVRNVRVAARRYRQFFEEDPTGESVGECDVGEISCLAHLVLAAIDGDRELRRLLDVLPAELELARAVENAAFVIGCIGKLERTRALESAAASAKTERMSGEHSSTPDVPPFQRDSGDWIRNKDAADREGLDIGTLRTYRNQGCKSDGGYSGRDIDGRLWRRIGTAKSHPWYYLPSLKSEKKRR